MYRACFAPLVAFGSLILKLHIWEYENIRAYEISQVDMRRVHLHYSQKKMPLIIIIMADMNIRNKSSKDITLFWVAFEKLLMLFYQSYLKIMCKFTIDTNDSQRWVCWLLVIRGCTYFAATSWLLGLHLWRWWWGYTMITRVMTRVCCWCHHVNFT